MSKSNFDFGSFYNDVEVFFAANKNLYTKAQADELFVKECDLPLKMARTSTGYVYYAIGYNDGHEKVSGYWVDTEPRGRHPIECWLYRWSFQCVKGADHAAKEKRRSFPGGRGSDVE